MEISNTYTPLINILPSILPQLGISVYGYRFFFLTVLLLLNVPILAQNSPHPSFRQYTTDDGLPSSEVYHILQDNEGFIWISTDNGVCRFDGYEFRNYGVKDGLVENVIFMMQLDALGRVWMQAMNGRLYYIEEGSIHPYWNNKIIDTFGTRMDSKGFIVEGEGEMIYCSTVYKGVVSIAKDGTIKQYCSDEVVNMQVFAKKGKVIKGTSIFGSIKDQTNFYKHLRKLNCYEPLYFYTPKGNWSFPDLVYSEDSDDSISGFGVFYMGEGKYLFQTAKKVWLIENGEIMWQHFFPDKILHAQLMSNGQLFVGLHFQKGLLVYESIDAFRENNGSLWLEGKSVSYFMECKNGDLWIATDGSGAFYALTNAFTVYDKETGLLDEHVTALTIKNENEIYFGLKNGEIWLLNKAKKKWITLAEIPTFGAIRNLCFDQQAQQLWAGRANLVYLQNDNWLFVDSFYLDLNIVAAARITINPSNNKLWFGNYTGFGAVILPDKKLDSSIDFYKNRTYITREDFESRVWVGQVQGLFEWKDDTLHRRDHLHPAFSLRVEDIALMPDSTLVVATKGGGLVFWKGDQFEQLTTEEGLTADMLECVYADEEGNVWAGTLNGLNRISGTFGNRKVKQITRFHGLPSNEINQVCRVNDHIWVATNKGLVHFLDKKINNHSPKPILASILVNNHFLDLSSALNLSAKENNLTLNFFAINYKMNAKIPYRYRLDGGDWSKTLNRSLNFIGLSPGEYFFEIQAQNEDGVWSKSTGLTFAIRSPWWLRWWAKTLLILIVIASAWRFYFFRTKQLKKAHDIQLQMTELERSALQAQMNPHFIFNCLNSIQNFILLNKKEPAILYLGRFANLVRSMLNASVLGKIPLEEEIALLNNYLELEKLRFKNQFNYEIKMDEKLDLYEIRIPPLLIQPYVENAIIHGTSEKTSGGKIEVWFAKKESYLEVAIVDNGTGIKAKRKQQLNNKSYKSFGMAITKNRLELLSDNKDNNSVITHALYDKNDKIIGTKVLINIRINENIIKNL